MNENQHIHMGLKLRHLWPTLLTMDGQWLCFYWSLTLISIHCKTKEPVENTRLMMIFERVNRFVTSYFIFPVHTHITSNTEISLWLKDIVDRFVWGLNHLTLGWMDNLFHCLNQFQGLCLGVDGYKYEEIRIYQEFL